MAIEDQQRLRLSIPIYHRIQSADTRITPRGYFRSAAQLKW
jgi:hypothetical protein